MRADLSPRLNSCRGSLIHHRLGRSKAQAPPKATALCAELQTQASPTWAKDSAAGTACLAAIEPASSRHSVRVELRLQRCIYECTGPTASETAAVASADHPPLQVVFQFCGSNLQPLLPSETAFTRCEQEVQAHGSWPKLLYPLRKEPICLYIYTYARICMYAYTYCSNFGQSPRGLCSKRSARWHQALFDQMRSPATSQKACCSIRAR